MDSGQRIKTYLSQSLAQNLRHYLAARADGKDSYQKLSLPDDAEQKVLTYLETARQGQESNRALEERRQRHKADIRALWSRYRQGYEAILRGDEG